MILEVEAMMRGAARVMRADRRQLQWDMLDLEGLLPGDHRARMVWAFVESLDLSAFYEAVQSREGEAGRPPPDPAVVLSLWLYATLEGIGSARELERLCARDVAYRWLAGGVPVNYHGLSDFRVGHGDRLDRLLSESVAAMLAAGLIDLDEVTVDGTKIKAWAGKGSFAGENRIARAERLAVERVERLKAEIDADPGASLRRRRAATERAASDIAERAKRARQALDQLKAEKAERVKKHAKEESRKGGPRVSLTDPEARWMRFADGSVKAGYNIQIAATGKGLVLSVMASDRRNDAGLAVPMVNDVERRYGRVPKRLLVDTSYATADDILTLATRADGAVQVYAPPPEERDDVKPETLRRRTAERAKEPQVLKDWRSRMDTAEGQTIYRRRRRIELVNAHMKNRGFERLNLRGLVKARIVALWHALAHNILVIGRIRLAAG
jgi:transposase